MSNLIALLQEMGQSAEMRHADSRTLYEALSGRSIDAEARWAILRGDGDRIAKLLEASRIVCCAFAPEKHNDEDEEAPKDDDEIRSLAAA